MTLTRLAKQMLDFHKTAFDSVFNFVILPQARTANIAYFFPDQIRPFHEGGQKTINDWAKAFKKGREDLKEAVDENFKNMETLVPKSGNVKEAKTSQPSAKL